MKLYKIGVRRQDIPPVPEENKAMLGFAAAAASDVGCLRRNNEDNFLLCRHINESCAPSASADGFLPGAQRHLTAVFDGIGGGAQGEMAALLTARVFREAEAACRGGDPNRVLRDAFQTANRQILALREETGAYGTTAAVVCTDGSRFKIWHLGDSRVYLLRDGNLFQLTRDHTLARVRIDGGFYREDDPRVEKDRNRLTEYVGRDWTGEETVPEESRWIPVQTGDCILLCSDGLYGMCRDREILQVLLRKSEPKQMAADLVSLARERGGADNITCICMVFRNN